MNTSNFESIYKQYSPQIYRVCMGYINDHDKAKDLVQETFISVWKSLSSFKNLSHISTWIFRIATNHCLRAIEVSKRSQNIEFPIEIVNHEEETQEEKLAFLYNCIAELPETDRIIISLVLEDLPQAEIADIVGLSHSNIRVKVHRIKEKLATKFKANGQFK